MSPGDRRVRVQVEDRTLQLSNLDKALFPTGFTKGDMLDYYARVAPVMLRHLAGRPVTVKRFPQGVDTPGFIEKNVPRHAPAWVRTVTLARSGRGWGRTRSEQHDGRTTTRYVIVDGLPALMWLVNLAAVEFHTPMWRVGPGGQPRQPDLLVFDLDPGQPATITQCCQVALGLQERTRRDGIELLPKTSGSKGLQLYASVTGKRWREGRTNEYARSIAEECEQTSPQLAVSRMAKSERPGKVLIDWSQNNPAKTTVSPYSLRAVQRPTVSTPLTWDEVATGADDGGEFLLGFTPRDVLDRIEQDGDLFDRLGASAP
jgi:bifunctional non-homologous end joining protein LigD